MKVVVTHPIPGPALEMLRERGHEVVVGPKLDLYEREELARPVEGADALLTLHYDEVDAELLDAAGEQLQIIEIRSGRGSGTHQPGKTATAA